jgi:diguanylate cyclase (GGDEF)-like protein
MNSTDSYAEQAAKQARLVVDAIAQVIPGTEIVALVAAADEAVPGFTMEYLTGISAKGAFVDIKESVCTQLQTGPGINSFTKVVNGVEWGILVDPVTVHDGATVGALVVARNGKVWSNRERSLTRAFSGLLSNVATLATREDTLVHQKRLDELVAQVAERLMSADADTHQEVLNWTTMVMAEFLGADVAFIRRNDHVRGLSMLAAEYPLRQDIPDPDPLDCVPFDSDPIFLASRDLRTPYLTAEHDIDEVYHDRVSQITEKVASAGAAVPLLLDNATWGILAFIHFNKKAWSTPEINSLQAVASLLVQLQGRIDAEERTRHNATHDELTGLPNRRALLSEIDSRLADKRNTTVMLIDLDRFKVMNDYLGHANGDKLIVTIADRIRFAVRPKDFVARLGGDEFVLVADGLNDDLEVVATSQRILELVARPMTIAGQEISHTASIGIAGATNTTETSGDILGWADVAMYAAKARGRNQAVILDDALRASADERSGTEIALKAAIEEGGLRLHFQPEVDLITGEVLAVESLVRWAHLSRGLLAAAEFIPLAEETGLVTAIGRWVFSEACRQLGIWQVQYPNSKFVVRINMSPADFKSVDLVEFVEKCLRDNNVSGERLCIEITEYVVVDEPERVASILQGFRELGIEIALDDFGTGFASMTGLKDLPVDMLKLDMSFVRGILTDAYDRAIVESIVRLGAVLGLGIIAEGIETPELLDGLISLGCRRGQGYLISRPVAPDELSVMLSQGHVPASTLHPAMESVPV